MTPFRITSGKTRIIFLDLEFYVPEKSRTQHGFCYNPWDKSCRLIGGVFLTVNPRKHLGQVREKISRRAKARWIWNFDSERELVESIYQFIRKVSDKIQEKHDGRVSTILCGIGITSSDIPILFDLFKRYKLLSNSEAFFFQNKFRILDLSQLAIATFNNSSSLLYPKIKNDIMRKYFGDKKFESGRAVWDMYEKKEYEEISTRVIDEVVSTQQAYELINTDYKKFKALEKEEKKRVRLAEKALLLEETVK